MKRLVILLSVFLGCMAFTPVVFAADPPEIVDVSYKGCISELATSPITVSTTDPEGGPLSYAWEAMDGGAITGSGSNIVFSPPNSGPHPCPYRVKVTITSSVSGLSTEDIIGIYVKLSGDVNGDGVVNILDKVAVRNAFGLNGTPRWIPADVNADGVVNILDKVIVRNQFGQSGCVCTLSASITSPSTNTTIVAGQSVNFKGAVSGGNGPFTYAWNFGGGATNVTVRNPGDVIFSTPGTYTVALTVSDDDGGVTTDTITIEILQVPSVIFIMSGTLDNRSFGISSPQVIMPFKIDNMSSANWSLETENVGNRSKMEGRFSTYSMFINRTGHVKQLYNRYCAGCPVAWRVYEESFIEVYLLAPPHTPFQIEIDSSVDRSVAAYHSSTECNGPRSPYAAAYHALGQPGNELRVDCNAAQNESFNDEHRVITTRTGEKTLTYMNKSYSQAWVFEGHVGASIGIENAYPVDEYFLDGEATYNIDTEINVVYPRY